MRLVSLLKNRITCWYEEVTQWVLHKRDCEAQRFHAELVPEGHWGPPRKMICRCSSNLPGPGNVACVHTGRCSCLSFNLRFIVENSCALGGSHCLRHGTRQYRWVLLLSIDPLSANWNLRFSHHVPLVTLVAGPVSGILAPSLVHVFTFTSP